MISAASTVVTSHSSVDPGQDLIASGSAARMLRDMQADAAADAAAAAGEAVDIRLTPDAALSAYGEDPAVAEFVAGAEEIGVTVHKLIPTDKPGFRKQALDFVAAAWTQTGVPGFRVALQAGQVVIYTVDEMPASLNVQAPVTLTSYAAGFRQASLEVRGEGGDPAVRARIAERVNLEYGVLPEGGFFAVWPKTD